MPGPPQASSRGLHRPEQDGPARIWARTRHTYSQGTWSLRRRLGYAFAIAAGLLAVGCLLGGLALNSMISAVNLQINRLDPAARDTSSLLSSLLTAENGVRGYIITSRQSFLTPYRTGLAQTAGYLTGLHQLIDPYPGLAGRLSTVETRASAWRTDYAQPAIATVRSKHTVSGPRETTGNQDFASARAAIDSLNSEILAQRNAALRRLHSATTDVIVLAITGAALLIAAGAAAWAAMNAWVTGPLAALGREAQVVASGGLSHVLNVSGPREIMELAADVEAMRRQLLSGLDDLSFKAAELERSNHELEQYAYVASDDLPTVDGDQTLLTQLFQNLIANSIKFRRLDEHPVIRITAQQGDGIWTFACRDNGIGIAPAYAERVFVIFQRLHPREAYPGTGIGLALCRKIVDFHGGHIWIDTTPTTGEGTTIRWTLPASDGHMEGRAT